MDVSQIAHRHFRESCCAQELGGRLYAFPAHGGKRLARPVCVVSLEKIKTLLRLRLREPESINHHNTTVGPQKPKPVGEGDLRLA
jgi:hypothetical protein